MKLSVISFIFLRMTESIILLRDSVVGVSRKVGRLVLGDNYLKLSSQRDIDVKSWICRMLAYVSVIKASNSVYMTLLLC